MDTLFEITGWLGACATLSAYGAFSLGWIKGGRLFHIANLLGACAFIINGAYHDAMPTVAVNAAWGVISALALFRSRRTPKVAVWQHEQLEDVPVLSIEEDLESLGTASLPADFRGCQTIDVQAVAR